MFPKFAAKFNKLKRFGMAHGESEFSQKPVDITFDPAFKQRYELPVRLEVGRYVLYDIGTLPTHWISYQDRRGRYEEWSEEKAREGK